MKICVSAVPVKMARMRGLLPYLLVGVGGFVGANARYAISSGLDSVARTRFPLATFAINISGSFLLGILGTIIARKGVANADAIRLALGVGFLGAFTTFSTFELETHALLVDGAWLLGTVYMLGSLFFGLIAVRSGIAIGRAWLT
jgi:fluoride exporter